MSSEESKWRQCIVHDIHERNRNETKKFQELIQLHNKIFDHTNSLRNENLQLTVENQQLRSGASGGGSATDNNCRVAALEQKLMAQQEELTELHRRRGESAQQIIDLNAQLLEKGKLLLLKDNGLSENISIISCLKAEVQMLSSSLKELESLNTMLRDEHTALQLAFVSLEEKLRRAQDENRVLVERLIKYKAKDADKMNEENESFLKKRNDRMRRELEEAAREGRNAPSPEVAGLEDHRGSLGISTGGIGLSGAFYSSSLPTKVSTKFDAHDGEVNAVCWSPVERLVATGGADRKVKLWDIGKGGCESRGTLVGSNAGVMSVDFDTSGALILGASNDYASRVWTVSDQRLRHTLTGHSGKVMAAKFLGEPARVVTGSHDRTLKIWDLRSRACIETKFAGSSCNDLVTSDGSGSTIISGHFDKRIRFWDTRTADSSANDILLQGKVTSLDLSRDCNYLISCVRDDTIKLLDLRMNQIIGSFSHDNFKVGCDWARAAFSPDGTRVAAGSADGSIFVWHSPSGRVEATLRDHTSAVTAVSWHSYGTVLASVDRTKKCAIWGDA